MKVVLLILTFISVFTCQSSKNLTQNQVLEAFKKANLPLLDLQTLTAETDPIKLLGKPNQYIEKSVWKLKKDSGADEMHKLEVFKNTQDLEARKKNHQNCMRRSGAMGWSYLFAQKHFASPRS